MNFSDKPDLVKASKALQNGKSTNKLIYWLCGLQITRISAVLKPILEALQWAHLKDGLTCYTFASNMITDAINAILLLVWKTL